MGNKKNSPEVRFNSFSEDWANQELGEIANFSKGRGYSKSDLVEFGNPIILYGKLYTRYQTVFTDIDTFALVKEDSVFSTGKEVIVPSSGETSEDIARASAVASSGILLGGDLNIIYPTDCINPVYLALILSHGKTYKELITKAQGKSVVHLRNSDLEEVVISFPSPQEQTQIGDYFQNIDQLINQQQQKQDKLLVLKKAMLAKMFPKEGANAPEIRFKGFSEKWEEKALGEMAECYSGGTPSVGIALYYGGEIPFIRSGEINSNSTKLFITENGLDDSSAKLVEKGVILYALYGATSGEVGISNINGAINQAVLAIKTKNKYDSKYLAQWLRKQKKSIVNTYIQGGQGNLSGSIVKDLEVNAPCEKEQQKIGDYFQNLDNLINQNKEQLAKLKQLRKACLTKMFVSTPA